MKFKVTVEIEAYDIKDVLSKFEQAFLNSYIGRPKVIGVEQYDEPVQQHIPHFTSSELEKIGQIVQVMRTMERMK